jgi:hypothetical protein
MAADSIGVVNVTLPASMLGKNHVVTSTVEMEYNLCHLTYDIHHMVRIDDRVMRDLPPHAAEEIRIYCEQKAKEVLRDMQSHIYETLSDYNHPNR